MEKLSSVLSVSKSVVSACLVFLFPLFFLPITQEFFITNKLYFLGFGVLLLMLISSFQLLVSKKLVWQRNMFDGPVVLFLLTVGLSVVISSPNKIQALLNPNFGFLALLSLTLLYFYLSRSGSHSGKRPSDNEGAHPESGFRASQNDIIMHILFVSSFVLSLLTILFFFQPFQKFNLPGYLAFLKAPGFTPLGNQLDLAIFLGFFAVLGFTRIYKRISTDKKQSIFNFSLLTFNFSLLTFNLLALSLTLYSLLKPISTDFNRFQLTLPPFNLSWYAAVETLKAPLTALFGVGVDNFASMFTRVKDIFYNQSTLWQINSFSLSRSTILHIFTETGLFGIVAFGLLVFSVFKQLVSTNFNKFQLISFAYLLISLLLFPPSLPVFFLFFFMLSQLAKDSVHSEKSFDMSEVTPLFLGFVILSLIIVGGAGYFLGRSYVGEYSFKLALEGIVKNNIKDLYDNQRQAIILNPYIERYRINFSQTNLLIANNIASKSNPQSPSSPQSPQLTDADRQTITQAIQSAIAEAKAAVGLNPQKAGNWENLAVIYRNILNVAQGADVWTISAYQRAVVLDPQNAQYRLNLGGVYYSLANYDEAAKLFEQSVALKSDWPNAHYNLAWASYQKTNYQLAVNAMQNAISLLDPKTARADTERAQKELEEFKKKLPKEEEEATKSGQVREPSQLTLPTPQPTIEPKLKLPKEASPEAR